MLLLLVLLITSMSENKVTPPPPWLPDYYLTTSRHSISRTSRYMVQTLCEVMYSMVNALDIEQYQNNGKDTHLTI